VGQHFLNMEARLRSAETLRATGIAASVRIATKAGLVAAGDLSAGDSVLTRDSGYRPVREVTPLGLLPCGVAPGAMLWLRPDHGILGRDAAGAEVLIPVRRLLPRGRPGFTRHLVLSIALDRHEVILAEGQWIESAPGLSGPPARPRAAMPEADDMRNFRVAGGGHRA